MGFALVVGVIITQVPPELSFVFFSVGVLAVVFVYSPVAVLIALLIFAPLRTLVATEASIQLPLDTGQILFIAFVGRWFMHRVLNHQPVDLRNLPRHVKWLIVYVTVLGLSFLTAASKSAWLSEWLKWCLVLLLVILVINLRCDLRWIVFGLTLSAVANALVGIYIFLGGSGAPHLLINDRFFRAFGTFGQPNPFGGFMGVIAPVTLMVAYNYVSIVVSRLVTERYFDMTAVAWAVFYSGSSLVIVLALFLSWSRGAWLGFAVSMVVVFIALPRRRWQSFALAVVLFAGGIIGWNAGFIPQSIAERIGSATEEIFVLTDVRAVDISPENYPIVERLAHWQASLNMAEANPWLGVGAGNYEAVYDQYRLLNWREPLGHAHNYYLNVFAETGIIGLITYMAMVISILWSAWQSRQHPDTLSRLVAIGVLGAWVYLTVHSLTDNLYVNNVFLHLAVMLGLLAVIQREITGIRDR